MKFVSPLMKEPSAHTWPEQQYFTLYAGETAVRF